MPSFLLPRLDADGLVSELHSRWLLLFKELRHTYTTSILSVSCGFHHVVAVRSIDYTTWKNLPLPCSENGGTVLLGAIGGSNPSQCGKKDASLPTFAYAIGLMSMLKEKIGDITVPCDFPLVEHIGSTDAVFVFHMSWSIKQ